MSTLKCVHELPWESEDFPNLPVDWYESSNCLAEIACAIGKKNNQNFVQMPFDTTLEGECLGAKVKWRDNLIHGMLVENYKVPESQTVDEWIDQLSKRILLSRREPIKRLEATKDAISMLKAKGYRVIFNLTGPITVLSAIMGFENLLRFYIRQPEQVDMLFYTLEVFYDDFLKGIKTTGIDLISYADPLGNKEVIGGRYFEKWSGPLQVRYLELMKPFGVPIHVCGNMSTGLAELGLFPYGQLSPLDFESGSTRGRITGLNCIHAIAQTKRQVLY